MKRNYAAIESINDENDDSESSKSSSSDEEGNSLSIFEEMDDINEGGEIILRSSIECKKKNCPKNDEYEIVHFGEDKTIQEFFLKRDKKLDMKKFETFDESSCFFCNWFAIIKKERSRDGNVEIVYNTYPDVGSKIFNELKCLILECSRDFTKTVNAFNYYVAKIQEPINRNIRNKNCNNIPFPEISEYEIYLHATHDRKLEEKMNNIAFTFMNCSDFVVKNMGLIKREIGTGKYLLDKDLIKSVKDMSETATKIYGILNTKRWNEQ